MPKTVRMYTIEELCNENKKIIIQSQDGIEIGIEVCPEGTSLYLYLGNEVVNLGMNTLLIKPKK